MLFISIKSYNLSIPRSLKGRQSYRRKEAFSPLALRNMKFLNFCLLLLVIFALLDPDKIPNPDLDTNPLTRQNTDSIRIRNSGCGSSGSRKANRSHTKIKTINVQKNCLMYVLSGGVNVVKMVQLTFLIFSLTRRTLICQQFNSLNSKKLYKN